MPLSPKVNLNESSSILIHYLLLSGKLFVVNCPLYTGRWLPASGFWLLVAGYYHLFLSTALFEVLVGFVFTDIKHPIPTLDKQIFPSIKNLQSFRENAASKIVNETF